MDYPGEKFILKMWETVAERGIGGLFKPWQVRREGRATTRAKVEEVLALAQAESDVDLIKRGDASYSLEQNRLISRRISNAHVLPPVVEKEVSENNILADAARDSSVADKIKREINITKALLHAEEALSDEIGEPPTEKPDEDWLSRWSENAGGVSNEEMQGLWGRILAGEIKDPGRFSLRVLDFMKNLNKEEADLISDISSYMISGVIFKTDDSELFNKKGIEFSKLLELEDLGILIGVSGGGLQISYIPNEGAALKFTLIAHDHVINVNDPAVGKKATLNHYGFTKIGSAIAALGSYDDDFDYIFAVKEALARQGIESTVHKISTRDSKGRATEFSNNPVLYPNKVD